MLMVIKFCSEPYKVSAKVKAVSVLPTPDGPASIITAIGLFGSPNWARAVVIRLAINSRPWSWPMTRCFMISPKDKTDLISSLTILPRGIPVHSEITVATACSSTSGKNIGSSPCIVLSLSRSLFKVFLSSSRVSGLSWDLIFSRRSM